MAHKHLCYLCDGVIAEGDFDCDQDRDHDYELCQRCAFAAKLRQAAVESYLKGRL